MSRRQSKPLFKSVDDTSGDSDDEVYEVETILDKRIINGKPQYLIKYKGYDDSENSWEPPSNLNCPKKLREFEREFLRKKNAKVQEYHSFERILKKRTLDGNQNEYLVKWAGNSECTWVKSEEFFNKKFIEEFENSIATDSSAIKPEKSQPRTYGRRDSTASDHSYQDVKPKKEEGSGAAQQANGFNVPSHSVSISNFTPEKVLDLIKRDNDDIKCLVKFKGLPQAKWISADEIRYTHPLLLIDYYETRIILRKKQCEMAFDCTDAASENRKLVVKSHLNESP